MEITGKSHDCSYSHKTKTFLKGRKDRKQGQDTKIKLICFLNFDLNYVKDIDVHKGDAIHHQ